MVLRIKGDVQTDAAARELFSEDYSMYKVRPKMVAHPRDLQDVVAIVEHARTKGLPITCRGGGSGLSGAALGSGIVIDFARYMNKIIAIRGKNATVQPGVIFDAMQFELKKRGLMLPPRPSSSGWCTIGGNVATRAVGPLSARYGTIDDYVRSLEFVTAKGATVDTAEALPRWLERGIMGLRAEFLDDREAVDRVKRRAPMAGGYNLKAFLEYRDARKILTHLMVGSVGTLGIISEIRLALAAEEEIKSTMAMYFKSVREALEAVPRIMETRPVAVELLDELPLKILGAGNPAFAAPNAEALLMVEYEDGGAARGKSLAGEYDLVKFLEVREPEDMKALRELRRKTLEAVAEYARAKGKVAASFIDDVSLGIGVLADAIGEIKGMLSELGVEHTAYGHAGFGSIHVRPILDMEDPKSLQLMEEIAERCFRIVSKYGGSLVGEHNAGRARSIHLPRELGGAFEYMKRIKELLDPEDILNPGVLFDAKPITSDLKYKTRG